MPTNPWDPNDPHNPYGNDIDLELQAMDQIWDTPEIWRPYDDLYHKELATRIRNQNKIMADMVDFKPSKSSINSIIMDYLISEGFPGAAEKFAQETNLSQAQGFDSQGIRERVQIRNAILTGNVEEAIEFINDVDAEILDTSPLLHFRLLQLQLIEIIREVLSSNNSNPAATDFRPAIEFATSQLSPRAPTDQSYLTALEQTMALMIFQPDKMPAEMKELLDLRLRETVAEEVNKALLKAQGMEPVARIRELVRARAWAETTAKAAKVDLPDDMSIGLDVEHDGGRGDAMVT
ncbi:hypothetical protein B0A48_16430 [Cryoendolithus antarcticus]|uniref:CTLH domain-containing protein n=1 Tax=Cryoendolithus antarcticus TaxID=1507870 RepID=A0A1V8SDY6_9PEZI|nr:hypothetical protein B0A48_16430 [Cryoendolithus antarcticus]